MLTETILIFLSTRGTALFPENFHNKQVWKSTHPGFHFSTELTLLHALIRHLFPFAQVLESDWLQPLISWVLLHPCCRTTNLHSWEMQRNRRVQWESVSLPGYFVTLPKPKAKCCSMNHEAFTWVRPLGTTLGSQHASRWEANSVVKWLPSSWMNYQVRTVRALVGTYAYLPLASDVNDKTANDHPSPWQSGQSKTSAAQHWQGSAKGECVPHLWHRAMWLITPCYKWPLITTQLQLPQQPGP